MVLGEALPAVFLMFFLRKEVRKRIEKGVSLYLPCQKPVVSGEGLPALFLCFLRTEMRKEHRKRKERVEIDRVIFLKDSGPESGGEEEGKRLGG